MGSERDWDTYFLRIADAVATRSTCPKASVGAVVVIQHQLVSTGYNGAPRGLPHCADVGCLEIHNHCARVIHAELNAMMQASNMLGPDGLRGAYLYATHLPCFECSKVIINYGLSLVVFSQPYVDDRSEQFGMTQDQYLQAAGVTVRKPRTPTDAMVSLGI